MQFQNIKLFYALNYYLQISKSFNQFFFKKSTFNNKYYNMLYSLIVLYKFFFQIKYELKKSSFKVFNNIVDKYKYYTIK